MSEKSPKGGHITGAPYGALPRLVPTGTNPQEHGPLFFCQRPHGEFDDYQQWTLSTAVYPDAGTGNPAALTYAALGLCGEAGEVADKLKKVLRDKGGILDVPTKSAVAAELGDVLWYVARLADEIGLDLSDVVQSNRQKLTSRQERGVLKGSGDDR